MREKMKSGSVESSWLHILGRYHFALPLRRLGRDAYLLLLLVALCFSNVASGSVDAQGQFLAEIPIEVPPYHGLEPKLALTYHSTPANGWIGAGWSLSGGPSYIRRVSKGGGTPRLDGSDVFLLDGMELVPCQPQSLSPSCTSSMAAFGSSNGFYSTKIENFQRLQYASTTNTWHIWAKNGNHRVFGPDFLGTRWVLTSETDTHGNQVTYTYQLFYSSDTSEADSYLVGISYAGRVGGGPGALIQFYYSDRPDAVSYGAGRFLNVESKRVTGVDVLFAGKRIRVYSLNYHTSQSTSGTLLDSVQMFGKDALVNCGVVLGDSCDSSKPQGVVTSGTSLPPRSM
jgi:hypothetical protein